VKPKAKLLIVLTILLVLLTALAIWWEPIMDFLPIDQSGWKSTEQGIIYRNEDGHPLTGWQTIDGSRYYFDEGNGVMYTGLVAIGPSSYQMDENGVMQTGWVGGRYFLVDGPMALGWTEIDGKAYFFDADGFPVTGWKTIEESTYFFDENGNPLTGWQELDGKRFFFADGGQMCTGWLENSENRYYLASDGSLQTGWVETGEGRFYLGTDGAALSGWQQIGDDLFYLAPNSSPYNGWLDEDGKRYYLDKDGKLHKGWLETEEGRFYLDENGLLQTGWLETDGKTYYLLEDGSLATGKQIIDGETHFFTSTGNSIVLVNPWNYLPEDYTVELTELDSNHKVATVMVEALEQMLADCEAAGHKPYLYSSYRTTSHQQYLFNNMLKQYNGDRAKASRIVAVPGTSEHQLGLAVDITDYHFRKLNSNQEKTETQKWLMEHCWEYGFILRYPNSKSEITGIIYEPWHYRYVGLELAAELKDSGICLEEYLDQLTNDGTTCGGGNAS